MPQTPDLAELAASDGRYPVEAFAFVGQSLRHIAKSLGKDRAEAAADRHLNASQLVDGVIDLAAERFGLLGDLVLRRWGIRSSDDVGTLTFVLIAHGVFSKQPGDRIEDFYGGPDLPVALRERVVARTVVDRTSSG